MRDIDKLSVDEREMLRYMGYSGQHMASELIENVKGAAERCESLARPRSCFTVYEIKLHESFVELKDTKIVFRGRDIADHLKGAVSCAVMAVTLGVDVEREIMALEYKSVTQALIFNSACTALVESAADACQREIALEAEKRGLEINSRYSPGYGDFPLEQQRDMLALTGAERALGLTLTDGGMMVPRKSVTAVVGLFPMGARGNDSPYSCDDCPIWKNCMLRKGGGHCGR